MGSQAFIFGKTARVAKIFRLLRLLRLFNLYRRFEARREAQRRAAAFTAAGGGSGDKIAAAGEASLPSARATGGATEALERPAAEAVELTLIEMEIQADQNQDTRVGQRLQGGSDRGCLSWG